MRPNDAALGLSAADDSEMERASAASRRKRVILLSSAVRWLALGTSLAIASSVAVCRAIDRPPLTTGATDCVPSITDVCGSPAAIVLVHVGKTGGDTVAKTLTDAGVQFIEVHDEVHTDNRLRTPGCAAIASFTHFIVMSRDPVDRAVSAFNWASQLKEHPPPKISWKTWEALATGSKPPQ